MDTGCEDEDNESGDEAGAASDEVNVDDAFLKVVSEDKSESVKMDDFVGDMEHEISEDGDVKDDADEHDGDGDGDRDKLGRLL